jgi:nicotinamide mononucleotide transporter
MFLGISYLEWSANIMTAVCIFLAGRNSIHTWWTGIIGCILFGLLFFDAKLYADATLQVFFVATGIIGWVGWMKRKNGEEVVELPVTFAAQKTMIRMFQIALVVAAGYGWLLYSFTDAFAPWIDSLVLTLSVVGQLLLMRRNVQTWPVWVVVNILSVPLYFSRELYLSAGLYTLFLLNAIWSWKTWYELENAQWRNMKFEPSNDVQTQA